MVKVNVPSMKKDPKVPEPYQSFNVELQEAIKRVVRAACGAPVIFAGGEMISDDDLLAKARLCINAGGSGFIFGRNIWQRPLDKALEITAKLKQIIREGKTKR